MSQTTRKPEGTIHESRLGLHLSLYKGPGKGRVLAGSMAGIAPDDAFEMAERQDDCSNGKEEITADNTPRRTQAGPDKLGKDFLSTDG